MKSEMTARTASNCVLPKPDFSSYNKKVMEEASEICGKAAGVCYSSGEFSELAKRPDAAVHRFNSCLENGHYSIAEHYNVSIMFEGISKMQALILNSVQIYSTSERSGRYTPMTGNSETEISLYNKWMGIFDRLIKETNPRISEKAAIVRAQENARYILSVFTHSTNMYYTANLRQWNSLLNMLKSFYTAIESLSDRSWFEESLREDLNDLIYEIELNVGFEGFKDDACNCQNMFTGLRGIGSPMSEHTAEDDHFGDTYCFTYNASLVQLAHIQRHRAIKYFINSDFVSREFYVPVIIRGTEYEKMWVDDLKSVSEYVPQATLVQVTEVGYMGDFLAKCKHRLCGRVQLETEEQVKNMLIKMYSEGQFSSSMKKHIDSYFKENGEPKTKCEMKGYCKETCGELGVEGTPLNRNI